MPSSNTTVPHPYPNGQGKRVIGVRDEKEKG